MALPTQLINLPFTQGADSKTDPRLSGKPSRVENMQFVGGTLQRRYGTTAPSMTAEGGSTLSSGGALFSFGDELTRISSGTTYGLGVSDNKWVSKAGGSNYATLSKLQLIRNGRTQINHDAVTVGNITVLSWYEASGSQTGTHIAVYDELSGTFYQTGATKVANSSAATTRCAAIGKTVLVFVSGNPVYIIDTSSPATAPTTVSLGASVNTRVASCAYGNSYALIAYFVATSSKDLRIAAVDASGAILSSPAAITFSAAVVGTGVALNACIANGNVFVAFTDSNDASVNYVVASASTLASVLTKTAIGTNGGSLGNVAAMVASGSNVQIAQQFPAGAGSAFFALETATLGPGGVVTALAALSGGSRMALVSDGFVFNGTNAVAVSTYPDGNGLSPPPNVQPGVFVIDWNGNMLAAALPGTADDFTESSLPATIPRACALPGGGTALHLRGRENLSFYGQQVSGVDAVPVAVSTLGISRITLTPVNESSLPALRIGKTEYIGGALPRVYDGQQMVEAGFAAVPDGIAAVLGAGGALSAGVYSYFVVYSWINSQGELQRSATGSAATVTATATQKCTLAIPVYPLSGRDAVVVGNVTCEVYRTEANGTLFYRVSSPTSPVANSLTATNVSFVDDTVTDAALIEGLLLYTTGGVLDNVAAPAYSISCEHLTRLVIVPAEDPFSFLTSTPAVVGQMVNFNEVLGGRVPSATGPITGMASMDGNLILLTSQAGYIVLGQGPDNLGNNPWQLPARITSVDSGAVSPQSVVSTEAGIFFQGAQGIYLLERGLQCNFIGADVQAYGKWKVRSATVVPSLKQVRFQVDLGADVAGSMQGTMTPSPGGVCLVYDYFYRQWDVWTTNAGAQAACIYGGAYTRLSSNGVLRREVQGTWGDAGALVDYLPAVETQWIKVSGIQGFQRVRRLELFGEFASGCTVTCEAAFDYSEDFDASNSSTFSGAGISSPGGPLQFRWLLPKQKCEAVRFRFTVSGFTGSGKGAVLTGLTLEVGVKQGPFRLRASQSL